MGQYIIYAEVEVQTPDTSLIHRKWWIFKHYTTWEKNNLVINSQEKKCQE